MMMRTTAFVVLDFSIYIGGSRGETFCTLTVICAGGVFSSLVPSLRVSSFSSYPVLILNMSEILRAGYGRVRDEAMQNLSTSLAITRLGVVS